ncbi:MAG: DUF6261 family protein [Prevotellaceae bacterium]|jgi:uncharacterized protein YbgA (DUF1722 family)|nr:DUF6261 family protein [Prevotellaceae bacterium]
MPTLLTALFKTYPNAAHYRYCTRVKAVLGASADAVKTKLGPLLTEFNAWQAKEFDLMEWVRRSVLTEKIAAADRRADEALVSIRSMVRALEYSLTPAVATAAHQVNNMLQNYGKVYKKPYNEQIGDLDAILAHFSTDYLASATTLGLTAQIAELQAAYTEFLSLFEQRGAATLAKPPQTFTVVRRGIENVYHPIETILNAGATMGIAGFAEVINLLNPDIEHLNNEHHRARRDLTIGLHTFIVAIPAQAFTGKPITPNPTVLYSEVMGSGAELLELGKDYNLTFKNNIEPGMAQLTVHGKGAYKGRVSATFTITEN